MRREERVTVQGPVKKQQPDGMSHGGGLMSRAAPPPPPAPLSPSKPLQPMQMGRFDKWGEACDKRRGRGKRPWGTRADEDEGGG